jgi:Zn-dependent protease with chaperone function
MHFSRAPFCFTTLWTGFGDSDIFLAMIPLLIVGSFLGALLLSIGLNWLALIPWRRSAGAHWTERARLLFPARRAAKFNLLFLVVFIFVMVIGLAPQLNPLAIVVPMFFGGLLSGYFLNRAIYPGITFMQWLRFIAAIWLLVSPMIVLIAAASVMPANFGITTWLIAAGGIILLFSMQKGLNVRLLRYFRIFKPAPERLTMLVRDVSEKMGVPAPTTWIAIAHISNAAALVGPRELVFTDQLLATHPDEEIKAICAHELGHLTEPKNVRLARLLLPLCLLPLVFLKPIDSVVGPALNWSGPNSELIGFLCSFIIILIPMGFLAVFGKRLAQRMEKRADKVAVEHQEEPAVYARALERLYQTNQMPAVMRRRLRPSAHPDLYDRMLAAGITPEFPKPAPPGKFSWSTYGLIGFGFLAFVVYAVVGVLNIVMRQF